MLGDKKIKIKVGGDFDPVPMDKYTVQITDVDLVTQYNQWKGAEQEVLKYQFTILDNKPMEEGEETTRGRLLWARYTPSLGARSNLGKLVNAVYGRELTKEEMESFDPEAIIGQQVDAMVEQQPSKDGTQIYNNILSVSKNLKKLAPVEVQATPKPAPIKKKSVPAVAPDAGENPDEFIAQAESEKATAAKATPVQPAVAAQPEASADEASAEAELAAAEAEAAELAVLASQAKVKAAKAKAALVAAEAAKA